MTSDLLKSYKRMLFVRLSFLICKGPDIFNLFPLLREYSGISSDKTKEFFQPHRNIEQGKL
jgi:hypothetical protein